MTFFSSFFPPGFVLSIRDARMIFFLLLRFVGLCDGGVIFSTCHSLILS